MDEANKFMKRAVALARRGRGMVSPNPLVGAVVVRNGRIIGEGWHKIFGGPHAEVFALEEAGSAARGADLYVTLEPCSHVGKTPACAPQIVSAGMGRVFIGRTDPNPLVSGKGIQLLEAAGIEVISGILESGCSALNQAFFKYMKSSLPYITLKSAQSLDGFIAAPDGYSKWISSEQSRKAVHRLRVEADAVMVGIGTVLADDPMLTVRSVRGRNPQRLIYDSSWSLQRNLNIVKSAKDITTRVIYPAGAADSYLNMLGENGITGHILAEDSEKGWLTLLKELGHDGIHHILVEGGPKLHSRFLSYRLADRLLQYTAPRYLGLGIRNAAFPYTALDTDTPFMKTRWKHSGPDIVFEGIWNEY